MRIAVVLAAMLCAAPAGAEDVRIPITDAQGGVREIVARVCRPDVSSPYRIVVINHGAPPEASRRPAVILPSCDHETVRWFTARDLAVVLPLRRGYGATGGRWDEHYGGCARGDFVRAGRETARDIAAAIAWAVAQPWALPEGVIVIGQSAGGWGSVALAAIAPPEVSAIVNIAGGRGGQVGRVPGTTCNEAKLIEAAGRLGEGARVTMLWLYTANDSFVAPPTAVLMHEAFTRGGGEAELRQLPAWRSDGHGLFFGRGGSRIWGPVLAAFLNLPP
ncbi:alpha/beta hydrolase family protein [Elioraea sp.]|uniref:alpha/beta hydrolase family protein n=1 Tax=Elioraea sp. TaxID=2185103 RepID=UPI003F6EB4B0